MKNLFKILLISCLSLICAACGGGSSSATPVVESNGGGGGGGGGGSNSSESGNSAYTIVTGIPYVGDSQTGGQFYDDLLTRLSTTNTNVPVSRLLLGVVDPSLNPLFTIGSTVASSGLAVQFISQLANANPSVQIYAYPDVEDDSGDISWENWTPPTANPAIPSCSAISQTSDVSEQRVLKSICWSGLVNQLIATKNNAISGNAYDGQGFALTDTDANRALIHGWTVADGLNLGWLSAGLKSSVDLNVIEVYDLAKTNNNILGVDTIVPDSVPNVVKDLTPTCSGNFCSYDGIFPGTQWTTNNSDDFGTVGANIYQCAISTTSDELTTNGCNSVYTSNVETTVTADMQMMQSLNFILLGNSKAALSSNIYGTPPSPSSESNVIVFLFSAQYKGAIQSYTGSGGQCVDSAGNCSCVASKYNSIASCGDENGFGSWDANLTQFKSFTTEFLTSQAPCTAPGGCAIGIYEYDFIPQAWYN